MFFECNFITTPLLTTSIFLMNLINTLLILIWKILNVPISDKINLNYRQCKSMTNKQFVIIINWIKLNYHKIDFNNKCKFSVKKRSKKDINTKDIEDHPSQIKSLVIVVTVVAVFPQCCVIHISGSWLNLGHRLQLTLVTRSMHLLHLTISYAIKSKK